MTSELMHIMLPGILKERIARMSAETGQTMTNIAIMALLLHVGAYERHQESLKGV